LMPAAVVHSSTARFAHSGTGTVRMCSFANQVSDYPALLANLEILRSESSEFGPSQAAANQQRKNRPMRVSRYLCSDAGLGRRAAKRSCGGEARESQRMQGKLRYLVAVASS
jgi:hypothetical protein